MKYVKNYQGILMTNTYTFNSLSQSYLSILTSVELVSQISLSVSVCLFVCFSVWSTNFWEWLNIFFRNFAYGSLRHCWGSYKYIKNSHLSSTSSEGGILDYFYPFLCFLCSSRSWELFNIFSLNFVEMFLALIDGHYTQKNHCIALSPGGHLGIIFGLIWCLFQYFSKTVQYFLVKFYTDVLGILH